MTNTVPADERTTPEAAATSLARAPEYARHGGAFVSMLPGAGIPVTAVVDDQPLFMSEAAAEDLYRCLDDLFGPLAETRRAARSSVALAGGTR